MSYLRLTPPKDAVRTTKDVAPPAWPQPDAPGVWPEGAGRFTILAFTRPEFLKTARERATSLITEPGKPPREEVSNEIFTRELFGVCLKGWTNLLDPETDQPIPFTPENVEALPEDAQGFLVEEILKAGRGILASREIITRDLETGAPLDYKSPDAQALPGEVTLAGEPAH